MKRLLAWIIAAGMALPGIPARAEVVAWGYDGGGAVDAVQVEYDDFNWAQGYATLYVREGSTNLRDKPGTDGFVVTKLGQAAYGRVIDAVLGEDGYSWFQVSVEGYVGWLRGDLIDVNLPTDYAADVSYTADGVRINYRDVPISALDQATALTLLDTDLPGTRARYDQHIFYYAPGSQLDVYHELLQTAVDAGDSYMAAYYMKVMCTLDGEYVGSIPSEENYRAMVALATGEDAQAPDETAAEASGEMSLEAASDADGTLVGSTVLYPDADYSLRQDQSAWEIYRLWDAAAGYTSEYYAPAYIVHETDEFESGYAIVFGEVYEDGALHPSLYDQEVAAPQGAELNSYQTYQFETDGTIWLLFSMDWTDPTDERRNGASMELIRVQTDQDGVPTGMTGAAGRACDAASGLALTAQAGSICLVPADADGRPSVASDASLPAPLAGATISDRMKRVSVEQDAQGAGVCIALEYAIYAGDGETVLGTLKQLFRVDGNGILAPVRDEIEWNDAGMPPSATPAPTATGEAYGPWTIAPTTYAPTATPAPTGEIYGPWTIAPTTYAPATPAPTGEATPVALPSYGPLATVAASDNNPYTDAGAIRNANLSVEVRGMLDAPESFDADRVLEVMRRNLPETYAYMEQKLGELDGWADCRAGIYLYVLTMGAQERIIFLQQLNRCALVNWLPGKNGADYSPKTMGTVVIMNFAYIAQKADENTQAIFAQNYENGVSDRASPTQAELALRRRTDVSTAFFHELGHVEDFEALPLSHKQTMWDQKAKALMCRDAYASIYEGLVNAGTATGQQAEDIARYLVRTEDNAGCTLTQAEDSLLHDYLAEMKRQGYAEYDSRFTALDILSGAVQLNIGYNEIALRRHGDADYYSDLGLGVAEAWAHYVSARLRGDTAELETLNSMFPELIHHLEENYWTPLCAAEGETEGRGYMESNPGSEDAAQWADEAACKSALQECSAFLPRI